MDASLKLPTLRSGEILYTVAAHRGTLYRWIALGFYPPEAELVEALNQGRMASEINEATAWLGQDRGRLSARLEALGGLENLNLPGLSGQYAALFDKGVQRISLRESTYLWRDVYSLGRTTEQCTQALQRTYSRYGLRSVFEGADHAALEFEFLAFLCSREAESWQTHDFRVARELRRSERDFVEEHLIRWLPELSWRISHQAAGSFYDHLAELARLWLDLDQGPQNWGA
jgi:DMSO reductase family type II enzyme chaperone